MSAEAEYHAQFRTDIAAFVLREVVDAAVIPGRFERGPITNGEGQQSYFAFTDPSGGSADSFTLAVAHREADTAILDAIREVRPPFSPESVVDEFAEVLRTYGLSDVTGDRYSGEFVRERNDPFVAPGSQDQGNCRSVGNDRWRSPRTRATSAASCPRDRRMVVGERHRILRRAGPLCRARYGD